VNEASSALIELHQVSRSFDSGRIKVLDAVSLTLEPGQALAITGPSGSGKSTLLNLLGGLDHPDSGHITVAGRTLSELKEDELANYRNKEVGFIFQLHHLLPQCTALENVLMPTLVPGQTETATELEKRARQYLERVGLGQRLNHRPGQLSGGERQRVAVIRSLINKPRLLLADEPTGALDQQNTLELMDVLTELNQENNGTLVVVTHAVSLAKKLASHYRLENGQLTAVEEDR
jgi:lipoprotein-releasing system ATP-binding protein